MAPRHPPRGRSPVRAQVGWRPVFRPAWRNWQRTCLVNRGLGVRVPPPAPIPLSGNAIRSSSTRRVHQFGKQIYARGDRRPDLRQRRESGVSPHAPVSASVRAHRGPYRTRIARLPLGLWPMAPPVIEEGPTRQAEPPPPIPLGRSTVTSAKVKFRPHWRFWCLGEGDDSGRRHAVAEGDRKALSGLQAHSNRPSWGTGVHPGERSRPDPATNPAGSTHEACVVRGYRGSGGAPLGAVGDSSPRWAGVPLKLRLRRFSAEWSGWPRLVACSIC